MLLRRVLAIRGLGQVEQQKRGRCPCHDRNTLMTKLPTNPSQPHVPVSPAPIELLNQYQISPLPNTPPTKNAQSTTKTSPTSPTKYIPYTTQTECKPKPQYKHQPKEEHPRDKTRGVHPNPNVVCQLATILAQQPNGHSEPKKGLSTSISLMIQS